MLNLPYIKRRAFELINTAFPTMRKHRAELNFWSELFATSGGRLWNGHFEPLFTTVYDLAPEEFRDKKVLDIGCGPWGNWNGLRWRRNVSALIRSQENTSFLASKNTDEICQSALSEFRFQQAISISSLP